MILTVLKDELLQALTIIAASLIGLGCLIHALQPIALLEVLCIVLGVLVATLVPTRAIFILFQDNN